MRLMGLLKYCIRTYVGAEMTAVPRSVAMAGNHFPAEAYVCYLWKGLSILCGQC